MQIDPSAQLKNGLVLDSDRWNSHRTARSGAYNWPARRWHGGRRVHLWFNTFRGRCRRCRCLAGREQCGNHQRKEEARWKTQPYAVVCIHNLFQFRFGELFGCSLTCRRRIWNWASGAQGCANAAHPWPAPGVHVHLNSSVETAKYAKHADEECIGERMTFTRGVEGFEPARVHSRLNISRGSRGSRFIPTAVSKFDHLVPGGNDLPGGGGGRWFVPAAGGVFAGWWSGRDFARYGQGRTQQILRMRAWSPGEVTTIRHVGALDGGK